MKLGELNNLLSTPNIMGLPVERSRVFQGITEAEVPMEARFQDKRPARRPRHVVHRCLAQLGRTQGGRGLRKQQ